jgi:hypothetical protein
MVKGALCQGWMSIGILFQPLEKMLPDMQGRFGIFTCLDLIDLPGSVCCAAEAGDGEFAMVADLVEGVFSLGDGVKVFVEAKVVGG